MSYWRRYLLAAAPLCALIAAFIVAVAYSLDGLSPAAMFVDGQPPKTWDAVKAGLPSASSLLEAFYFGTVTATTIGYGDHHLLALEPGVKVAAALYVVLVVVASAGVVCSRRPPRKRIQVFANCVSDILLIRSRQQNARAEIDGAHLGRVVTSAASRRLSRIFSDPRLPQCRRPSRNQT